MRKKSEVTRCPGWTYPILSSFLLNQIQKYKNECVNNNTVPTQKGFWGGGITIEEEIWQTDMDEVHEALNTMIEE